MNGTQEQPTGALTLTGAAQTGSPDPALNPQGALQSFMTTQAEKKQSYLEQQQAAYNKDMAQYAQMIEQSRQPEASEAGRWGSIAQGFSSVAPTWGNIGGMLGKGGAEYGKFVDQTQQMDVKNQGDLTKLRQAEVRALESKDQSALMAKALGGSKPNWIQFKDDAGNLIIMDKTVGPASQQIVPAASRSLYEKALAIGAKLAHDTDEADPAAFAIAYAKNAIAKAPGAKVSAAATQLPTASLAGQLPEVTPVGQQRAIQAEQSLPTPATEATTGTVPGSDKSAILGEEKAKEAKAYDLAKGAGDTEASNRHAANLQQLAEMISALPEAQRADVQRNFDRYSANPNAGTLKGIESSLTRAGALPTTATPVKNRATAEGNIETSKLAAKEHAEMGKEISARSTNFQNMSRLLDNIDDDLKALKPGSPVEPGKLANFNSGALSWMKAMGVPLSPEGEAAVANAIALGKTNIQLSAADTKAISSRPAVFEFMQMLKANPGPELTADTIKKLTDQMRQNVRFGAQENQDFVNWHKDNPLAPTVDFSNYQNLVRTQTPWWNKFAENYKATHGRYPTYADLAKDAKDQGMTFNELIGKMHAHAGGRK
jgi:hypothetical protein